MSDLEMVQIGGETISLAELAGYDFSAVPEKRTFSFPPGHFLWQVSAEPNPPKLQKMGDGPAIAFNLKCLNVLAMKKDGTGGVTPEECVGQMHRETFFIRTIEDFGWVKAFLVDIGVMKPTDNPLVFLEKSVDAKFAAWIIHTPNRNDKDAKPYININREKGKIIPYVQKTA